MERLSPCDGTFTAWSGRQSERKHSAERRLRLPRLLPSRRAGSAMGPRAAKFGHLGWPACINIAKCLQLVRTAESFAAPASIMGSNFVGANSDSSADPFAIPDLPSAPNRICEWRLRENAQVVRPEGDARAAGHTAGHTGRTSNEIQTRLDDAGRRPAPGR